jgi:hypothetical protein
VSVTFLPDQLSAPARIGREHGREGLEAYLETKTVWTNLGDRVAALPRRARVAVSARGAPIG